MWLSTQVVFAVALLMTPLTRSITGALVLFSALSFPLAAAFTIPWSIVTLKLRHHLQHERCLYTATFNLSQASPGIIVSLFAGLAVKLFNQNLSAILAVGGLSAFASALCVLFVDVPVDFHRMGDQIKTEYGEDQFRSGASGDHENSSDSLNGETMNSPSVINGQREGPPRQV